MYISLLQCTLVLQYLTNCMTRARRNETFTSVLQRYECVAVIRVHYTDASVLQ